jgi:hypothetical protein
VVTVEEIRKNVTRLTNPSVLLDAPTTRVLFSQCDPNRPWYSATDIVCAQSEASGYWPAHHVTDDSIADFSPKGLKVDSNRTLAVWERITGDVSDATDPGQVAPHLDIATSWLDQSSQVWSTPVQLTNNNKVDRNPVPVMFGTTISILWIENEADSSIGNSLHGDRLMFEKWSGTDWLAPQILWSAPKGILGVSFIEDSSGEGHVVFTVDEDGDPNTRADRELYEVSTIGGLWQTAIRLTNNAVEDSLPVLVKPNGSPVLVWDSNDVLYYTPLDNWVPKVVYSEYTLANQAATLDGATMPGGAVIAYTVQGPSGVDIMASFYDASLDRWSLPRQMTSDEDVESALSLASDGTTLVMAYQKTQTERNAIDVNINGVIHHLKNIPQPARTDLYILRYTMGSDLAVDSVKVTPSNPVPGSTATITATIDNRSDVPLENVDVVFWDGDPYSNGTVIGTQIIPGIFIGGAKREVSTSWNVPAANGSHRISAVVDPNLVIDDRDRSNNVMSLVTVLPDLAVEQCWSTKISDTSMALTARVVNLGVIPSGSFDVSWRLGAVDGNEIGRKTIAALDNDKTYEITTLYSSPTNPSSVYVVVDPDNIVTEENEDNNTGVTVFSVLTDSLSMTKWEIVVLHGTPIQDGYVEARTKGITKLRVYFSKTMDTSSTSPSLVTLTSASGTLNPASLSWESSTCLVVNLASPLPDKNRYTIEVSSSLKSADGASLGGDRDICLTALKGDVDGNLTVNKDDLSAIRAHAGESVNGTNARFDVNCNGAINAQDLLAVQACLGNTATGCQ